MSRISKHSIDIYRTMFNEIYPKIVIEHNPELYLEFCNYCISVELAGKMDKIIRHLKIDD
jgi:hypothetical protein